MNTLVKAFASGAAGVFISDLVQPQLEKILKPDSEFARKALRAGAAGVGTAAAYWALGMFGK